MYNFLLFVGAKPIIPSANWLENKLFSDSVHPNCKIVELNC